MKRASYPAQRGAALLAAMLTVALVAVLAAGALWRQWRGVEVEAAERSRAQSAWLLTGALDWSRLILAGDLRESGSVDHLGEPWAVPLAEARLSSFLATGENSTEVDRDAFLSGQISDMQARLNVMNLVASDGVGALQRFERLFTLLGLPSAELAALQRNLARAQAAMKAVDSDQASGEAPLLPTRFDQLAWLGVTPATLEALRPYVTVLPLQGSTATPVNLNTASAEVIYAAVPGLDLAAAQALVVARDRAYFKNAATAIAGVAPTGSSPDTGWAAVATSFFEVRGRLRLDQLALEEVALVERTSARRVFMLWRERRAVTSPAPLN